jgi:hypothetical protein
VAHGGFGKLIFFCPSLSSRADQMFLTRP